MSTTQRPGRRDTRRPHGPKREDGLARPVPLVSLFEQVWAQDGRVAVQPHEDFLLYFQLASRRGKQRRVRSGSDGTRTRDLCRDRAAL
jgi:hypothetical protein